MLNVEHLASSIQDQESRSELAMLIMLPPAKWQSLTVAQTFPKDCPPPSRYRTLGIDPGGIRAVTAPSLTTS